jgi:hypothetical protein
MVDSGATTPGRDRPSPPQTSRDREREIVAPLTPRWPRRHNGLRQGHLGRCAEKPFARLGKGLSESHPALTLLEIQ